MSDIFREIQEDIRRERLEKIWKVYGWYIIALLVLIVIGLGGYQLWQRYETGQRIKASIAFDTAQHIVNPEQAAAAFAKLSQTAPSGYAELAKLSDANSLLASGHASQSITLYKQLAAADSGAVGAVARLRAAWVLSDTASRADLAALLQPLLDPKSAWRQMAQEVLAYNDYRSGHVKEAENEFGALAIDPDAPDALRSRANAFAAFLHGGGAVNYGTVPPPAVSQLPAPSGAAAP